MRRTVSGAVVERKGSRQRAKKPRCGVQHPRRPDVTCERTVRHDGLHEARNMTRWGGPPELSKGRRVRYVGTASASDPAIEEWPADVLRVHANACVDLLVMTMQGTEIREMVPFSAKPAIGTWHWPAF